MAGYRLILGCQPAGSTSRYRPNRYENIRPLLATQPRPELDDFAQPIAAEDRLENLFRPICTGLCSARFWKMLKSQRITGRNGSRFESRSGHFPYNESAFFYRRCLHGRELKERLSFRRRRLLGPAALAVPEVRNLHRFARPDAS